MGGVSVGNWGRFLWENEGLLRMSQKCFIDNYLLWNFLPANRNTAFMQAKIGYIRLVSNSSVTFFRLLNSVKSVIHSKFIGLNKDNLKCGLDTPS